MTKKNLPFLLISLALLAYTILRAINVSIYHDEALTYTHTVIYGWWDIIRFHNGSPNNHLINSLLVKFFTTIFTPSEFTVRLPNVLAHILFMWGAFRLTRGRLMVFLLFNLNPFVVNYFSQARGYGLALAFLMLAMVEASERRSAIKMSAWLSLAALSNFTFLYPVLAFAGTWFFFEYKNWRRDWCGLIPLAAFALIARGPIKILSGNGDLYYGGKTGFMADTVHTLISYSVYNSSLYPWDMIGLAKVGVIALTLLTVVAFVRQRKIFTGAFLLTIIGVLAHHFLTGTLYPIDRTAIFFIPIFTAAALSAWEQEMIWPRIKTAGIVIALFFSLQHFVRVADFEVASSTAYDADTKKVVLEVERIHKETGRPILLDSGRNYSPALDFYRRIWGLDWLVLDGYRRALPVPPPVSVGALSFFYGSDEELGTRPVESSSPRYPYSEARLSRLKSD